MDRKIKEIIENEMDCLITDVDSVIKKEGSLQALVDMLEVAINYTPCSKTLNLNNITFFEFTRSFCIKDVNSDYWHYKGIRYNDLELDLVYNQYINELNKLTKL